ncbi:putative membrane protein [[Clostridium] cellulosi]|jgi:hypothetical protein|uniref:Putative membrane protein n=1 Tax=[Clostridium] cellulosi TaxID=29343 RepID=A0A078KJC8_9FIRM|nr:MAG: hypothetical protein DIU81_02105 [[Clostridium] cellulosi]CDZ23731.1 putative membrane protein [[Clostridium] cellulosi]
MPHSGTVKANRKRPVFTVVVIILSLAVIILFVNAIIKHLSSRTDAAGKAIKGLSGGFSFTSVINIDGKEYEAAVEKDADGDFKMTFIKPANLNSLSFEKTDDGLKVKFGTLEAAVDASSIPQSSMYNAIINTFEACLKDGIKAKKQGNDVNIYGNTKTGDFILTLDQSLKPKSLEIPSLKFKAQFKDFKYT